MKEPSAPNIVLQGKEALCAGQDRAGRGQALKAGSSRSGARWPGSAAMRALRRHVAGCLKTSKNTFLSLSPMKRAVSPGGQEFRTRTSFSTGQN